LKKGDDSTEIVRTIVNLAHNLGMDVTAEGVETTEQCAYLLDMGCEHGQGYYFSKPLSSEAATAVLAKASNAAVEVQEPGQLAGEAPRESLGEPGAAQGDAAQAATQGQPDGRELSANGHLHGSASQQSQKAATSPDPQLSLED